MKTRRAIIIGFLIVAVFLTGCAFTLYPVRDAGFLISYAFVMLGVVAYFGSFYIITSVKFEKAPWRLPLIGIGRTHMIAAAVTAAVYILLSLLIKIPEALTGTALALFMTVYTLVHIAWVARTAYQVNALLAGANVINEVNDSRHEQAVSLRGLAAEAEGLRGLTDKLPAGIRGETAMRIGKVADTIRYSDPVVPDKLKGIDEPIRDGVAALRTRVEALAAGTEDIESFNAAADKLLAAIRDRNEQVKRTK